MRPVLHRPLRPRLVALVFALSACSTMEGVELQGTLAQGGLIVGRTEPGSRVELDGEAVRVAANGLFLIGFGREAGSSARLRIRRPDGTLEERRLAIAARDYEVQRIDGLPEAMVAPDETVLARIEIENERIAAVRARDSQATWFARGFVWPAVGPITGVYGSERILNGEPRQPHYGVDIAAPAGTTVVAPGEGIVAMAEPDLYYTGGTVIIDHGHGLTSALLHLASVTVRVAQYVKAGDPIGTVGATGRATGPHLDWRINLFDARIDPQLVVGPMPAAPVAADPLPATSLVSGVAPATPPSNEPPPPEILRLTFDSFRQGFPVDNRTRSQRR